jgi:hypothetical protein
MLKQIVLLEEFLPNLLDTDLLKRKENNNELYMINKWTKIGLLLILIILSNLYMLRVGTWFYQDTSYWYKNFQELLSGLYLQIVPMSDFGYYLGYDIGLFSFTRIISVLISFVLFIFFGYSSSQLLFTVFGLIISFVCFYLFSGLFSTNKNIKYSISLLYIFTPLIVSAEGYTPIFAGIPLFLFSFYKYFSKENRIRYLYLFLNIIAAYLIVSYVRYIEIGLIIITFYLVYFLLRRQIILSFRKIVLYFCLYFFLFLPSIYSLIAQFTEKSNTAINYGKVFGKFDQNVDFLQSFNYLYSFNVTPYDSKYLLLLGIIIFIIIFIGLVKNTKRSYLLFLNLIIFIFGISIYGLSNIYGNLVFSKLITFFPLAVNGPYWALFISSFSIPIIIGIVFGENKKQFYFVTIVLVVLSIIPLLNINQFQFRKFQISKIPKPYYEYFIKPYGGIPESTHYIPGSCWRAKYMQEADVPTMCINYELRFSPASYTNPRFLSGKDFALSEKLENKNNTQFNNLRVTHNLKNIIVANDIVEAIGPNSTENKEDIQIIREKNVEIGKNELLSLNSNPNFNHFFFTNKDNYDFYIYSPREVVFKEGLDSIFDNSLKIEDIPVVIDDKTIKLDDNYQGVKIEYKINPSNKTKYFIKISEFDKAKPFLIQLNQTYNKNWKLKWINKSEFEDEKCTGDWEEFSITNNVRCLYDELIINLSDIKFIGKKTIPEEYHFQGNYIGNFWLVDPKDISQQKVTDDELFAVIIYEKQLYYSYAIAISLTTFIALVLLTVAQELRNFINRKK